MSGPLATARHVTLAVLTFDRRRHPTVRRAYATAAHTWNVVQNRLREKYGPLEYFAVWEEQGDGFPHVNGLFLSEKIYDVVARNALELAERRRHESADGVLPITRYHAARELRDLLCCKDYDYCNGCDEGCADEIPIGFGFASSWELVDDVQDAARYCLKVGEPTRSYTAREVVKSSQLPIHAPKGFRSARASRGLLAPRPATEFTGAMVPAPKERVEELLARRTEKTNAERVAAVTRFLRFIRRGGRPRLLPLAAAPADTTRARPRLELVRSVQDDRGPP